MLKTAKNRDNLEKLTIKFRIKNTNSAFYAPNIYFLIRCLAELPHFSTNSNLF